MITLKEAYDNFRKTMAKDGQKTAPEGTAKPRKRTFAELLENDTGPIFGFSHDIFHMKNIWLPDCARTGLNTLITGETGTGKELVALSIHALSEKIQGRKVPIVRVNCTGIASEIIERELFGSTTQNSDKKSWLSMAQGGILFLDEIADLEERLLSKLMRALQTGAFSQGEGSSGIRMLASTNRPELVRADLRWRFPEHIDLEPLRRRRLDAFFIIYGLLNNHPLLEKGRASDWLLTPSTLLNLLYSPFPGNIRELRNAVDIAAARYARAPKEMPRFFNYRTPEDAPDILRLPTVKYDLWRNIAQMLRLGAEGRKLIPVEPPERSEISDHSVLRSLGSDDVVPCYNCAEALAISTAVCEAMQDESQNYESADERVYTADTAVLPLPPVMRWRYDRRGNIRADGEVGGIDFSAMSAAEAYRAYLSALRERCGGMSQAVEVSGLSDSTLRRHFKENDVRQYKGKRPGK